MFKNLEEVIEDKVLDKYEEFLTDRKNTQVSPN